MAKVTVTNLTSSSLSTDVGLIAPGGSLSMDLNPFQAYKTSEMLQSLVNAGKASVVVAAEANRLDALEPAAVGTASVADGTVTTAKLAAGAVVTAALANGAVGAGKIGAGGISAANQFAAGVVDAAALAAGAVAAGKIAVGGISAANQFATGVVDTAALAAGAVTKAKAKFFVSTEQTATGSAQDVAHGLGVVPAAVLVVPTALPDAAAETGFAITEGTHDATNVKVTATATVKYKVMAWA